MSQLISIESSTLWYPHSYKKKITGTIFLLCFFTIVEGLPSRPDSPSGVRWLHEENHRPYLISPSFMVAKEFRALWSALLLGADIIFIVGRRTPLFLKEGKKSGLAPRSHHEGGVFEIPIESQLRRKGRRNEFPGQRKFENQIGWGGGGEK